MNDHGPWLPPALRQVGPDAVGQFGYLVIDEITANVATLVVAAWPRMDEQGRVRFPRLAERFAVTVPLATLRQQLYQGLLRREPRTGDAFATEAGPELVRARFEGYACTQPPGAPPLWLGELAALLPGRIYDITRPARTAAKLAYYGAMTAKLSPDQAAAWRVASAADSSTAQAPSRELTQHG